MPSLITERGGWWAIDFPFGIAAETANALNLAGPNAWQAWLDWCCDGGDATERRDTARTAVQAVQGTWSVRRAVDLQHRTTWFPLFEQLYRQTIYGCRQVIAPVVRERMALVLPWHVRDLSARARVDDPIPAVICEGFPGVTIERTLRLGRLQYKGANAACRASREHVLHRLMSPPISLPISPNDAARALDDTEGDALDALTLIVAAWLSAVTPLSNWEGALQSLVTQDHIVEGWFPI